MSQAPLSLDSLDTHLFKCADIIRNTVDQTDYKDYILPLVFYKTISDTYQDQYEQHLEEYGDSEITKRPAFYEFVVPDEYSWDDFRNRSERVDEFINEAFDALSEANEDKLEGVLRADFVWTEGLDDDRLNRFIEHLSTVDLSLEEIPPDMRGEAYMDFVRHFASEEGRDSGEFFTPTRSVPTALMRRPVSSNSSSSALFRGWFAASRRAEISFSVRVLSVSTPRSGTGPILMSSAQSRSW